MPRWLPIAGVLIALSGVAAYGLLRPGVAPGRDPADVQQQLNAIPRVIDNWVNADDSPLSARDVNVGGVEAYLCRTYTRAATGEAAVVLLLYGDPGELGAHDPRVCYAGSGWALDGAPAKADVGETDTKKGVQLWSARFRRNEELLQVYWGWTATGDWHAADNPRFLFARHRKIYKLYAQQVVSNAPFSPDVGALQSFVPAFLRRLDTVLTSPNR